MTAVKLIEKRDNGIELYSLVSEKIEVVVANLGAHITSIVCEDKKGRKDDVVLFWKDIEDSNKDGSYMGATVGRVANRIGGAKFVLNNTTYSLAANNGVNHLHGGNAGFNQKLFETRIIDGGVSMTYVSPDGEEGYPGKLTLTVDYVVEGNKLSVAYYAVSDKDTLCNITNHTYFNLSGSDESICEHQLKIAADEFGCVDNNCLATGEIKPVYGTPFDFREYHRIGERIDEDNEQLRNGGGYDHSFILNRDSNQISLYHEETGRELTVSTTYPVVQVYSGNFLAGGKPGKRGYAYENRVGVALEVHKLPNSINTREKSDMILKAQEEYREKTEYIFNVIND